MNKALNSVLSCLTRREYSVLELKRKLEQKGYSSVEIEQALIESQRLGYQCDKRFAEQVCHARIAQGYVPLRIKQELLIKGISAEVVYETLEQENVSWLDRAVAVSKKKCKSVAKLSWDEQQKVKRFLLYRGFPMDIIADVFQKN